MQPFIELFGRLHPLLLHTPIGILPAVALLELLSLRAERAQSLRTPRLLLWWIFALSAIASASTGFVLAREPGYGGQLLDRHFYLGLAFAGLAIVAAVLAAKPSVLLRLGLLGAVGLVLIPTGHLGASLTHGEDFLTAPFHKPAPRQTQDATADTWFSAQILPIFENSCVSCHNESKAKGGLMLNTLEALMKGATAGPVVVPMDPDGSELFHRVTLPTSDEFHMPPEGKTPLTKDQIAAINDWIRAGASGTAKPPEGTAKPPEGTPALPRDATQAPSGQTNAQATATQKLQSMGCSIERRTMSENLLVITMPASVTSDAAIEWLAPLASQIADLSWPGSSPSTQALTLIRSMHGLERLDLRGSKPADPSLTPLAGHPTVRTLNLAGAALGDQGAHSTIESMPNLSAVFLWDSGATPQAIAALRAARPRLMVDTGSSLGESPIEQEPVPVLKNDAPQVK